MKNEVLETVEGPTVLNFLSPKMQNTMKSCQETFLICDFFHPYFMYINNILVAVCIAKLN